MYLHGHAGNLVGGLACEQFRDRALKPGWLSLIHRHSCPVSEHPGRFDAHGHVDDMLLNELEGTDCAAKLLPVLGELRGKVERGLARANCAHGNAQASVAQSRQDHFEPFAFPTEKVCLWNDGIGEGQRRCSCASRNHRRHALRIVGRLSSIDEKKTDLAIARGAVGLRYQDAEVTPDAVGDPELAAVHPIMVATSDRFGLDAGHVRSMIWFRHTEPNLALACKKGLQEAVLLLIGS